jgi:hypothetical protein
MASSDSAEPVASKKRKIEPRAIIEISPDVPRFRKRMEVRVIRDGEHLARADRPVVRVVDDTPRVASK